MRTGGGDEEEKIGRGCETWTLTLREEHWLRVFENKVLRKTFGAKRDEVTGEWRKLHNTELHAFYYVNFVMRKYGTFLMRWFIIIIIIIIIINHPRGHDYARRRKGLVKDSRTVFRYDDLVKSAPRPEYRSRDAYCSVDVTVTSRCEQRPVSATQNDLDSVAEVIKSIIGVHGSVNNSVHDGVNADFYGGFKGVHDGVSEGVHDSVRAGVHDGVCIGVHDGVSEGVHDDVSVGIHDGVCVSVHDCVCVGFHDVCVGVNDGVSVDVGDGVSVDVNVAGSSFVGGVSVDIGINGVLLISVFLLIMVALLLIENSVGDGVFGIGVDSVRVGVVCGIGN
ncbi:hypothetical protein ANN_27306 [Periplaneta americana]|uniref:Uncharacterized protein n=1 Tax=Periplaneta americana TaxID=6978 RepID=A0ABQ8RXN2_PERAM|nr:hypothetical protein ANN_27306 [Periplaneta americana]